MVFTPRCSPHKVTGSCLACERDFVDTVNAFQIIQIVGAVCTIVVGPHVLILRTNEQISDFAAARQGAGENMMREYPLRVLRGVLPYLEARAMITLDAVAAAQAWIDVYHNVAFDIREDHSPSGPTDICVPSLQGSQVCAANAAQLQVQEDVFGPTQVHRGPSLYTATQVALQYNEGERS